MKVLYLYSIYYCEYSFDKIKKVLDTGNCELLRMDVIVPLKLEELIDSYDYIVLVVTHNDNDIEQVGSIFYSYPKIDLPLDKLLILDILNYSGCEDTKDEVEALFEYPCYKINLVNDDAENYPYVLGYDKKKRYLCEGFLTSSSTDISYLDREFSKLTNKIIGLDNLLLTKIDNKFIGKLRVLPKNKSKSNILL